MKALAWSHYFARQQKEHGKTVFTAAELANVAQASPAVANVMVGRLVKSGVLERVARGVYGVPGVATLEALLPRLDSGAYITGARVLFDAGLITQSPSVTMCFSTRRTFRRERDTAVGRLRFLVVQPPVYAPPETGVRVTPEQALFDLTWTTPGPVDLRSLYTFRNTAKLRQRVLRRLAPRYPMDVQDRVGSLLHLPLAPHGLE